MTIVITAFERSPDGGKGLARDTRVRWALEEVGQPYEVRLVSFRAKKEAAHLRLHPFGLIPTYEEGDLALFETGAIVFHIAEHHAGLFPPDADARARAISWMFAALNTVEPPILDLVIARIVEGDKPWAEERLPLVKDRIRDRLVQLVCPLGRRRLARWDVQRGRPDDGVGAAQAESFGASGRVSQTGCLCCPRRSPARIQTGFRGPMGDQRRESASWLTKLLYRVAATCGVKRRVWCRPIGSGRRRWSRVARGGAEPIDGCCLHPPQGIDCSDDKGDLRARI